MKKNLYWVGMRASEIEFCKNVFKGSITVLGKSNISLQKKLNKRIDYNNVDNFDLIDNFFHKEILNIVSKDPKAKFMYYSQIDSYDSMKKMGLLDYAVCLNNQNLITYLSDKFKSKKHFKNIVPVLDYKILKGKYCSYENLSREFKTNNQGFVIQGSKSSGGSSTYILNDKNKINISDNEYYMVTKYCKNNIPINLQILISNDNIQLLPGSIQLIQIIDNKLVYKGCDFISYHNISSALIKKVETYIYKIAKELKEMGYIGICGVDSIIYGKEVYLMEINTRFQSSSTIMNLALSKNNLPSLQELNLLCFENQRVKLKNFKVNYSCYIGERKNELEKIGIVPILNLDSVDDKTRKEKDSYLESSIFDKKIAKYIK